MPRENDREGPKEKLGDDGRDLDGPTFKRPF